MRVELFRNEAPRLGRHRVFLFGSGATRTSEARSDFDIGVYGDEPLTLRDFYAIDDRLDALPTLYSFDWVDFNRVDAAFRERVMQHTETLYEG